MDNFFDEEINPIELLGYAKNNILDVLEARIHLPCEVENRLHMAYEFLTIVQEYLYNE
ncbi:MAG: hypothetical protein NC452_20895 [Eubacterium sp.]|nr:hypothetical protein [Eubacterium sp.]